MNPPNPDPTPKRAVMAVLCNCKACRNERRKEWLTVVFPGLAALWINMAIAAFVNLWIGFALIAVTLAWGAWLVGEKRGFRRGLELGVQQGAEIGMNVGVSVSGGAERLAKLLRERRQAEADPSDWWKNED